MLGVLSLLLPKQYSAESQIYLMADSHGGATAVSVQSIKYLSKSLKYLITTPDFAKKVIDSQDVSFERERWSGLDERARRRLWKKDVRPRLIGGTGLIRLKVYSIDKADALAFSRSITQNLLQKGFEYLSDGVAVKVVSEPLVSRWPTRPYYCANMVLGFFIGIFLSILWIIRKHSKRHFFFS